MSLWNSWKLTWLEDFISQFRNNVGYKIGICVSKKWYRRDQRSTIVINNIFAKFLGQFSKDAFFVEKFALVAMLEIFRYPLTHLARKFTICHVFFHLFYLYCDKNINVQVVQWGMRSLMLLFHDTVVVTSPNSGSDW